MGPKKPVTGKLSKLSISGWGNTVDARTLNKPQNSCNIRMFNMLIMISVLNCGTKNSQRVTCVSSQKNLERVHVKVTLEDLYQELYIKILSSSSVSLWGLSALAPSNV